MNNMSDKQSLPGVLSNFVASDSHAGERELRTLITEILCWVLFLCKIPRNSQCCSAHVQVLGEKCVHALWCVDKGKRGGREGGEEKSGGGQGGRGLGEAQSRIEPNIRRIFHAFVTCSHKMIDKSHFGTIEIFIYCERMHHAGQHAQWLPTELFRPKRMSVSSLDSVLSTGGDHTHAVRDRVYQNSPGSAGQRGGQGGRGLVPEGLCQDLPGHQGKHKAPHCVCPPIWLTGWWGWQLLGNPVGVACWIVLVLPILEEFFFGHAFVYV